MLTAASVAMTAARHEWPSARQVITSAAAVTPAITALTTRSSAKSVVYGSGSARSNQPRRDPITTGASITEST